MNRDHTHSSKLQEMKREIALLREELDRAKMEDTRFLSPSSKSKSDDGTRAVGMVGGMAEGEGLASQGVTVVWDTRQQLEELEERVNQSRLLIGSYSRCVSRVRGMLAGVLGGRGEEEGEGLGNEVLDGRADGEGLGRGKVLMECLRLLTMCTAENPGLLPFDPSLTLTSSYSHETISQLRLELEQCHVDLRTDELAFAEKGEELAEVQAVCEVLVREKGQVEGLWVAAQESEAHLQAQVDHLTRQLAALEGGMADDSTLDGGAVDDSITAAQEVGVAALEGCVADDSITVAMAAPQEVGVGAPSSNEEHSLLEASMDSLSEGAASISTEEQRFEATRSLMLGKVKTDSLEVRG